MLMFKMELVREAVEKAPTLLGEKRSRRHAKKRQVKAETTLKQSWSSDEFYQVISDGDGIELTVRVAKNRIPPKNEKQLNMPVSNNNTTTSSPTTTTTTRMMPSAAAAKETVITSTTTKKPNLLSEDCLQYKYMIEQMERWGREELRQIEYAPDSDIFCKNRLPASTSRPMKPKGVAPRAVSSCWKTRAP
ncbi:uncharacterized protein [Choristoneura fumiferana]|uniref:uncharacterized protein n=1 Tax=Choristoneura fumiferana TaxID=7141 RepID=UPI003D159CE1